MLYADEQDSLMGTARLELKVQMTLAVTPDTRIPVPARFLYTSTDPYAVDVFFDITPHDVVQWTFARDLLNQGLSGSAGMGDVKITPIGPHQDRYLRFHLESSDGCALIEGPAAPIQAWLAKTFLAVPAGSEPTAMDIDGELAELLTR
ncbi:putative SsgG protein (plasmid) [Streptomyces alboflavus]|uniref:Putative SsgG protein n=1 Tax=Streptomyces alboflavus TaxID=67267 RepID=A0A291W565_9ACTN|nr:SsgA family sporulation/cell division regulator [Streptomyces alboflavus]ATM24771.1 putative SsgG protein [Streptomyces alboflavus]